MYDRSKYAAASPEEIQNQTEKVADFLHSGDGRAGFLTIEAGLNVLRIFPAHLSADTRNFMYPKVVSWLPIPEVQKTESGEIIYGQNGRPKIEIKKKPIFNGRAHGKLSKDLIEEYVKFTQEKFTVEIQDKKVLADKLKPLTDWKVGILYKTSWVFYANKHKNGKSLFGRAEITEGTRGKINAIAQREGAVGPITMDLFSHPDTGKAIQIKYDPSNKDNKQKYTVTIIAESDWKLENEALEKFETLESLQKLYTNTYKRSDFEFQLKAIEHLDKTNGYAVMSDSSFQDIAEAISMEVEVKYPENEANETEETQPTTEEKSTDDYSDALTPIKTAEYLNVILKQIEGVEIEPAGLEAPIEDLQDYVRDQIAEKFNIQELADLTAKIADVVANYSKAQSSTKEVVDTKATKAGGSRLSAMKDKYKN